MPWYPLSEVIYRRDPGIHDRMKGSATLSIRMTKLQHGVHVLFSKNRGMQENTIGPTRIFEGQRNTNGARCISMI